MKLEGRVAIVTGAARGIGRAIAEKLREEGARIAVADLNGDGASAAAATLDGLAIEADISSEADANRIAAETLAHFGRVDVLVNASGRWNCGSAKVCFAASAPARALVVGAYRDGDADEGVVWFGRVSAARRGPAETMRPTPRPKKLT
jgi:NAD(P)-dependent dehydrogenase (short-subunit alcohol dehydrogenase family)